MPLFVLAIFAVTFLAYFPALRGGQLWDDPAHLTAPALRSWHGLGQIWFQLGATQQYYPVLHSAFWLEHRCWGDSVLGYHLLNVGLHATAACLFALVLVRLRPPSRSPDSTPPWRTEWLAAAVFALHPVCVESVAWMTEQKNTLSLVFYLLALLAYLRFDRERHRSWYAVALGFFVLALLSKSVTATLPAALLLVFYWQRGRLAWARDILPLLPWFIIGAVSGLFTAWVEHHYIGAKGAAFDLTLLQRGFLAGRAIWFYLGKLVWPAELIFTYPRWQVVTTWGWSLGLIGCLVALGGLWWWRTRNRGPLVAALFFVGSLFPVLGFFNVYPFVFSYVADHWQYLPSLGLIALLTEGVGSGLSAWIGPLAGRRRIGVTCVSAAGLLLVLLFALTWRQAGIYRNVETLYSDTLEKNPDCWLAHNNLGLFQLETGAVAESIGHFRAAVRLKPDCADAFNSLGNALAKIPGQAEESLAAFEQALRYDPEMPEANGNYGWALVNTPGRLNEGIAHLRTAIRLRPELFRAHNSLGIALMKLPEGGPEAILEFETALRYDPNYVAPRINLGNALVGAGRVAEGIAQLEWAQRLSPKDAAAQYNLGTALAGAGRPVEAAAAFEQALQLQPDNAAALTNLGNVLSQLGRDPEAIQHYRTSLRLDPNSAETHFNLGRALRSEGDGAEAIFHYREALRLAPNAVDVWNGFGSLLLRWERPDEAVAAYREAVRLRPDSAVFHNNLGIALTGSGQLDAALGELRVALQLDPQFADAHYNLGVALHQAGRVKEAKVEFAASGRAP